MLRLVLQEPRVDSGDELLVGLRQVGRLAEVGLAALPRGDVLKEHQLLLRRPRRGHMIIAGCADHVAIFLFSEVELLAKGCIPHVVAGLKF